MTEKLSHEAHDSRRKLPWGWGFVLAVRLAFRGLVRAPGTSLLAVGVLTLGLAAPTTFFSLLAGAIRPLPVPEGDRVIRLEVSQPVTAGGAIPVTLQDLELLRGASTLESLGAYRVVTGSLVDPEQAATRVSVAYLTPEVLPLLRVQPIVGRVPTPEEAGAGILLGHQLWQETYGGDPGVLGRVVTFSNQPRTITGILPEGFGFPFHENAWALLEEGTGDQEPVELVGRLAEGASLEAAGVEMAGRWTRGDAVREPNHRGGTFEVNFFTGGRGERGEAIAFLGLVLVALALLLIACANVANLLLVRATDRVRTLGVQSALGASRGQISVQLFSEALLLALAGGAGGVLLAWVGVDAIQRFLAAEHFGYFWMRMAVDGRVLVFALILIGGTALFAGTLPIVRILKADLQGVLKEGGGGASVGGGGSWSRGFVTTQLALSCAALVAAGLTGRSLLQFRDFGRGVPGDEILLASLDLAQDPASIPEGRLAVLAQGISNIVGVEGAALAAGAPGYSEPWGGFELEGEEVQRIQDRRGVTWNAVTPGYLSLLDLEIRSGRGFEETDVQGSLPVAVVSEAFASRYLPGDGGLGARIRVSGADSASFFQVVGIAEDVDLGGGDRAPRERVYLSLYQLHPGAVLALVRSGTDPSALTLSLRQAVARVDPAIAIWSVRTLSDAHAFMTRIPRAMAGISLAGGLGGLLVAAVGLYGLLAFRVRQRRRELGIRMAMGADGKRIRGKILKLALRQLVPATALGLLMAWLAAPVLGVVLLNPNPRSLSAFSAVGATFILVGLVAALVPAHRAGAVEPAEVLRGE